MSRWNAVNIIMPINNKLTAVCVGLLTNNDLTPLPIGTDRRTGKLNFEYGNLGTDKTTCTFHDDFPPNYGEGRTGTEKPQSNQQPGIRGESETLQNRFNY